MQRASAGSGKLYAPPLRHRAALADELLKAVRRAAHGHRASHTFGEGDRVIPSCATSNEGERDLVGKSGGRHVECRVVSLTNEEVTDDFLCATLRADHQRHDAEDHEDESQRTSTPARRGRCREIMLARIDGKFAPRFPVLAHFVTENDDACDDEHCAHAHEDGGDLLARALAVTDEGDVDHGRPEHGHHLRDRASVVVFHLRRVERDRLGDRRLSCLLYTSPSPRDVEESRMPSSA